MFRKQYKVKTSTTLKGSERRKLRSSIESSYPHLTPDDVNYLVPNKGDMSQVKAMSQTGAVTMIFCIDSMPMFFQLEKVIYPTVYTLWKFPRLLPVLTTNAPVLERLTNGADLMAPGVIIDESNESEIENLKPNQTCAIRIYGNRAPVAVGVALLSKEQLCEEGVKGKAVNVLHSFRDTLWESGDQSDLPLIPEVSEPENIIQDIKDLDISPEIPSNELVESQNNFETNDTSKDTIIPDYSMDEILYLSFMTALKVHGKKITLPILTSTFYSSYVLKCCPVSLNLDIKKTTHKKLSPFLKSMQKENLLQIKELSKGVESIVSLNIENEAIKSYRIDPIFKRHLDIEKEKSSEEVTSDNVQEKYKFPIVTELYVVSANVKVLFEKFNLRKGDCIPSTTIKDVLKTYVKENSLQNAQNPREVVLDAILCDCALQRGQSCDVMTWEQLQDSITSKMPHAYRVEFEGKQPIVKKGKLEPILINVETRTANKKVTLVSGLETYGIRPSLLAQRAQVAVAASTALAPDARGTSVLIQGNQLKYLHKTLLEVYKVPRKHIQGLESAAAKKK